MSSAESPASPLLKQTMLAFRLRWQQNVPLRFENESYLLPMMTNRRKSKFLLQAIYTNATIILRRQIFKVKYPEKTFLK